MSCCSITRSIRLSDEGDDVERFMGCKPLLSNESSDLCSYRAASPLYLLPFSCPVLLVSGGKDVDVASGYILKFYETILTSLPTVSPVDLESIKTDIQLLHLDEADHFDLVNSTSEAWSSIMQATMQILAKLR